MAYTSSDLTSVQSAILALAAGTRVVSVSINGKTIDYGQADLATLRALRSEIQSEINTTASRPRFVLTRTSKGL